MAVGGANTNAHMNIESARSTEVTSSAAETRPTSFWGRIKNVIKHPATVSLGISLGGIQLFSGLVLGLGVLALALTGTVAAGLPVFAVMAAGLMVVGAVILGLSAYGAYHCDTNRQQASLQIMPDAGSQVGDVDSAETLIRIPRAKLRPDPSDVAPDPKPPREVVIPRPRVDSPEMPAPVVPQQPVPVAPAQPAPVVPQQPVPVRPAQPQPERQRVIRPELPKLKDILGPETRVDTNGYPEVEQFLAYINGRKLPPVRANTVTRGLKAISVEEFLHILADPARKTERAQRNYMFDYAFPATAPRVLGENHFPNKQSFELAKTNPQVGLYMKHAAEVVMNRYGFIFKEGAGGITVERDPTYRPTSPIFHGLYSAASHVVTLLDSLYSLGHRDLSAAIYTGISNHPQFGTLGEGTRDWIARSAIGQRVKMQADVENVGVRDA